MVTESTLNPPLVRAADTVFSPEVFSKKTIKWWNTSQRSEFGALFFWIFWGLPILQMNPVLLVNSGGVGGIKQYK